MENIDYSTYIVGNKYKNLILNHFPQVEINTKGENSLIDVPLNVDPAFRQFCYHKEIKYELYDEWDHIVLIINSKF